VTGLSRTSLVEVIDERDPMTGELLVLQFTKKRAGKQRGIRMIHKQSLLDHLRRRAEEQRRVRFAPHVSNPLGLTVDQVCADFELFNNFADPDSSATETAWKRLTKLDKIRTLSELGILEQ
jgi:hypothetical protein